MQGLDQLRHEPEPEPPPRHVRGVHTPPRAPLHRQAAELRTHQLRPRPKEQTGGTREEEEEEGEPEETFPGHERDVSTLRLNTFYSTTAMVLNGAGYREVVAGSGFTKGDWIDILGVPAAA